MGPCFVKTQKYTTNLLFPLEINYQYITNDFSHPTLTEKLHFQSLFNKPGSELMNMVLDDKTASAHFTPMTFSYILASFTLTGDSLHFPTLTFPKEKKNKTTKQLTPLL